MEKESAIQKQIMEYLKCQGFFVWKNHLAGVRINGRGRGKNPNAGMPDVCALKDGITHYIEVKTPIGKLSEVQKNWHAEAYAHGLIVHIATSVEDIREAF